jgi:hypothetical protein
MSWLLVLLAVVIAVAALLMRGRGPAAHAMFLRRTGLTFVCVSTLFIGLFVVAESFADPGGWRAAGLTALWLLPMVSLSVLTWYRPDWATVPLAILTAGTIALAIWFAADPDGWREFTDQTGTGPVRALVTFAITLPIGLLGWRKPLTGGVMLLVLGLAPVTVSLIGSGFGAASLIAVSTPPALTGMLFLLAETIQRRASRGERARIRPPGAAGGHTAGGREAGGREAGGREAGGRADWDAQHTPGPDGASGAGQHAPAPGTRDPDTPRRAA